MDPGDPSDIGVVIQLELIFETNTQTIPTNSHIETGIKEKGEKLCRNHIYFFA